MDRVVSGVGENEEHLRQPQDRLVVSESLGAWREKFRIAHLTGILPMLESRIIVALVVGLFR